MIYDTAWEALATKNIRSGAVLDVGAGQGQFLSFLKDKADFTLYGMDLMHTQLPGVEWYVQDLNRNLQLQSEKFDAVTCIEVIEHVENPRKLVREMFRLLKPGGTLVLSTPNNQSWRSILSYIFRDHFVAFTDSSYPAHVTALNKTDILRICTEAGFVGLDFAYTNHGALPKWTQFNWQSMSGGALKGMRYSDNIICSARKPELSIVEKL